MTAAGREIARPNLTRPERVALAMLAHWMGERYFRTFRLSDERATFDAMLTQRERRVGVTVGTLWEGDSPSGAAGLESLVSADLEAGGDANAYALWVPPGASVPQEEPGLSDLRVLVARGLNGLHSGERREVRRPVTLRLAKIDAAGAYMSVSGGLAPRWTHLSEGMSGSFHLDSRDLFRLPEEEAEAEILTARVRDRAALLEPEEITRVDVHDYWLVSRVPATEPAGLTAIGAPEQGDPADTGSMRRLLRRHIAKAIEQRAGHGNDLSVLLLVGALAHIEDERVTAALRGMNPASYGAIDLIALVADGSVRQVLQPRSLPWET
ncbi:MAG: hypothetical protein AB7L91_03930 [Dehalococcoidia bacterium]